MSKQTIMLIFIFVLSNAFSAIGGYQFYQYRETAKLKAFFGVDQQAPTTSPSPESFFDITGPNDKVEKHHA